MPLNVCHLVLSLAPGGLENGLVNLVNHVDEDRIANRILCIRCRGEMADRVRSSVPVDCLDYASGFHLRGVWKIHRYLTRNKIDILHTRNQAALIWGGLAKCLGPGITHIHSEHGTPVDPRWLGRLLIKRATTLMSVAPVLAEEMKHFYRLPSTQPVTVIMNGVDTDRFRPLGKAERLGPEQTRGMEHGARSEGATDRVGRTGRTHKHSGSDSPTPPLSMAASPQPVPHPQSPSLRAELGLADNTVLFACIGRLDANKNQGFAIKAFSKMRETSQEPPSSEPPSPSPRRAPGSLPPPSALLIIGDGPKRRHLEELVAQPWTQKEGQAPVQASTKNPPSADDGGTGWELSIKNHSRPTTQDSLPTIIFLGFREDIARILPQIDCLLLPSRQEGMSNVILEANACAVPVLASDIPANRALVKDEKTGFLLPLDDCTAWGDTMGHIQSEKIRAPMGQAARDYVLKTFSIPTMVESYTRLYQQ